MSKQDNADALRVMAAGAQIKDGIANAIKLSQGDPVIHYTALLMEVAIYLDTWAELAETDKMVEVRKFADNLKDAIKNIKKKGN